jgi:excisionase family DNA binding protein
MGLIGITEEQLEALFRKAVAEGIAAAQRAESDVLLLDEAATLLRMSEKSVLENIRKRGLPYSRQGRKWRFRRSELLRWLSDGGASAPATNIRVLKGGT